MVYFIRTGCAYRSIKALKCQFLYYMSEGLSTPNMFIVKAQLVVVIYLIGLLINLTKLCVCLKFGLQTVCVFRHSPTQSTRTAATGKPNY